MDLVCVQLAGANIYSFLSAGWGFISDVDIESEKLRWMGDTR
jgi:sphingosine kinase